MLVATPASLCPPPCMICCRCIVKHYTEQLGMSFTVHPASTQYVVQCDNARNAIHSNVWETCRHHRLLPRNVRKPATHVRDSAMKSDRVLRKTTVKIKKVPPVRNIHPNKPHQRTDGPNPKLIHMWRGPLLFVQNRHPSYIA